MNDCSLTTGNPNYVAFVDVSIVKLRTEWVRLVSQNCTQFGGRAC